MDGKQAIAMPRRSWNRPASASIYYIGTNLLLKGAAFFLTPMFTRTLTSEEYGLYSLFLSWEALLTVATSPVCSGGILYRGLQKFRMREEAFLFSALLLLGATMVGEALLFVPAHEAFEKISGLSPAFWVLLFFSVAARQTTCIYAAREKYRYRPLYPTLVSLMTGIGAPLLALLLIARTSLRAEAKILAAVGTEILFSIPAFYQICKPFFAKMVNIDLSTWDFLLRKGLLMLPHYLAFMILSGADKILIGALCPAGSVGKYAVAFSAATALSALTGGAVFALAPWMMRKLRAGQDEKIRETIHVATDLLIPTALLFLAAAPELFAFLAPVDYRDALPAVYPLAVAVLPLFLSSLFAQAGMYYEKPLLLSLPSVFAAGVCLALNAALLPRVGFTAAGGVSLLAYTLAAGGLILVVRRMSGRRLLNARRLLSEGIFLCGGALLLYFFRAFFLPRVFFAGGCAALFLLRAKKAAALLRESRQKAPNAIAL